MTSRREFLKVGLAASALPMAAQAGLAGDEEQLSGVPLYKVLYDTRFQASVAFARRAAARGLVVQAMHGDMTGFWYDDLYHRWRKEPAAIAGLTAHGALFCLERLAWEQRMRVVFRGQHVPAAHGRVEHRFEGPAGLLSMAGKAAASADWAQGLADVVASCPLQRSSRESTSVLTADVPAQPAGEALFSWVIAPWQRA